MATRRDRRADRAAPKTRRGGEGHEGQTQDHGSSADDNKLRLCAPVTEREIAQDTRHLRGHGNTSRSSCRSRSSPKTQREEKDKKVRRRITGARLTTTSSASVRRSPSVRPLKTPVALAPASQHT